MTVSLAGMDETVIAAAFQELRQGQLCNVFIAPYSASRPASGMLAPPIASFQGRVDVPTIDEARRHGSSSPALENRLVDFERERVRFYDSLTQNTYFPGDKGFDYVAALQDQKIFWGVIELTQLSAPAILVPDRRDVAPPLGIARLEDWPTTLANMVLAARGCAVRLGHSRLLHVDGRCRHGDERRGIDLAAPYRGTYSDAAGAADVIADATGGGTLEDLMVMIAAQYTLPEVAPAFAWRGDIALFDPPDPSRRQSIRRLIRSNPDESPPPPDPDRSRRRRRCSIGSPDPPPPIPPPPPAPRRRRLRRSGSGHGHRRPNGDQRRLCLAGWLDHGRYGRRPPLLADRGRRAIGPSNAASHRRGRRDIADERSDVDRGFRRRRLRHRGAVPGARRRRSAKAAAGVQSQTTTVKQALVSWKVIYGRARVGGAWVYIHTTGNPVIGQNSALMGAIVLACHECDAIEKIYFGDVEVKLDASGNALGKWRNYVHIWKHLGTPGQAADPQLIQLGRWDMDIRPSPCRALLHRD